MFAEYCGDVRTTFRRGGIVRQKGALSSFHIPLETIAHRVWRDRYGGVDRGDQHCSLQREERMALTEHAEAAGCKLIIDPFLTYEKWGEEARRERLKCLKMFLQGMPDDKCEVAIGRIGTHGASYTYVGNWFAAESMTAISGKGYYQTIFTRHAPSIRKRTALFDAEFSQILREAGVAPQDSRQHAVEEITREIEKIAAVHDGL
jgi:hypothetical protein